MGRIFIAGIIQGSKRGKEVHSQSYRERLRKILSAHFPDWEIYCPVSNHPNSVEYSDKEAFDTFMHHIELVKNSSLVVAYVPEASMGTAIEMWEAYKSGVPVWSITPLKENWVVRITSQRIFESIEELESYLIARGRIWTGKAS